MELKGYSKKYIFKSKLIEVALVTWKPNGRSKPHDHGISSGWIFVLEGEVYQEIFRKVGLSFLKRTTHKEGEWFKELPWLVHIMGTGEKGAKTLHIYIPALKMKHYKESDLVR